MDWQNTSEVVFGLIMSRRLDANAIDPSTLMSPYDSGLKLWKSGKQDVSDLVEIIGIDAIQTAIQAEETINGLGEKADWIHLLNNSYAMYSESKELEQIVKKMKKGERDIDFSKLTDIATRAQKGENRLRPLSQVVAQEIPFIETGWEVIDDHLIGFPSTGLVVVGGNPKVGKTSWALTLAKKFVIKHTDKFVTIFSLEMMIEELKKRAQEVHPKLDIDDPSWDRLIVDDSPGLSATQIINRAASVENLGMIIIDFADFMIVGEASEPKYTELYMTLQKGAKQLRCPIVILAQLSGSYQGGLPKPYHIRYTRLVEAVAWMCLMLWNPERDYFAQDDDDKITLLDGHAYIFPWLVRGGLRLHDNDSPGAIAVPFKGDLGWHPSKSRWLQISKKTSDKSFKTMKR